MGENRWDNVEITEDLSPMISNMATPMVSQLQICSLFLKSWFTR